MKIGEELSRAGQPVEARRLEEVSDLAAYGAVVIGAPMIFGWHRSAVRFVKKHREALSRVPVAYFATAMRLTEDGTKPPEGVRLYLDPDLAVAPQNRKRLSIKERFTTVGNYLKPMLGAAREVKPVSVAFFGGKLELFRLAWWQMLFVMAVVQGQAGDYRNWAYIKGWGAELRSHLLG